MPYSAKPFIKWAGGKSRLLPKLIPLLPAFLEFGTFTRYVEPFVGGGAMFFYLAQKYDLREYHISDSNLDLINTYKTIRDYPLALTALLKSMQTDFSGMDNEERQQYYANIRNLYNANLLTRELANIKTSVVKAANFIFLNKTCFNGLYRVNRKGEFNTPIGSNAKPMICDSDNILAVSKLLNNPNVYITDCDYASIPVTIDSQTFIYLDPPYRPVSKTANFTSYSSGKFNDNDQVKLQQQFYKWNSSLAYIMMSNSDTQDNYFDDLYRHFNINRITANRAINSKVSARGSIFELVITNYPIHGRIE